MNEVNYRVEWVKNQLRERAKEKERGQKTNNYLIIK